MGEQKGERPDYFWWGVERWITEIKKAGVAGELKIFNDVITEIHPPSEPLLSKGPALTDVNLGGHLCDIYHHDGKKGERSNSTSCRLYIHIKS